MRKVCALTQGGTLKLASPRDKQPLRGEAKLPPSPHFSAIAILTLATLDGGTAINVARSFHVETTTRLLRRLGCKLDWVATNRLMLTCANINETPKRHVVSIGCYPWLIPLFTMFYTAKGSTGSLLVLRGECNWMLKLDFRDLLESVGSIGGRAWSGKKLSSLLVVEGFRGCLPTSLWRIAVGDDIYTVLGAIIATIATDYIRPVLLRGTIPYVSWFKELISVFNNLNLRIFMETSRLSIQATDRVKREIVVGGTCLETALLAAPIAASRGHAKLTGIIDSECTSSLAYMLRSIGCEVEIEKRTLILNCENREARNLITKIAAPPLALPYLGLGIAIKADTTLSEINGLVYEGIQPGKFGSMLEKLGFAFIMERDRIVSVVSEEPHKRVIVDCSRSPELCLMLIPPALSPDIKTEIVFDNAEAIESMAPGLLEALWGLGASFKQLS